MKIIKFILAFVPLLLNAQFTDEINSNRPGKSYMAYSVGKSVFQTEFGLGYVNEKHDFLDYKATGFTTEATIRWGVFKEELEFVLDIVSQNDKYKSPILEDRRYGLRQAVIGAKYLILDPYKNPNDKPNLYSWKANHRFKWKQLIPAVAVFGGVNFNFSGGGQFDNSPLEEPAFSPRVTAIAQNHFGRHWVFVTNLTYNKIATDFSSIDYIFTLTRGFNEKWSAFIENQGYNGKIYSDGIFRGGAAYLLSKDMQLDASLGTNIKNTPSLFFGSVGFSWRFTKNYKEIKLDKPNTKSKMDKKMEKAAKKKKRKDQVEE